MKSLNQAGSHVVVVSVGLLALGIIGFAGYRVSHSDVASSNSDTTSSTSSTAPSTIKTKADLTKTANSLNNASGDVNSSLDDSGLDSSLNDML